MTQQEIANKAKEIVLQSVYEEKDKNKFTTLREITDLVTTASSQTRSSGSIKTIHSTGGYYSMYPMAATYTKVKDLPNLNKQHLAWRLDRRTGMGYLTAISIARGNGEYGDMTVYEVFHKLAELSPHAAKIHARKVMVFDGSQICKS